MWRHFSIKNAPPTCLGLRRATTDFCRRRGRVAAANRISAVKLSIKKFSTNSAIGHERFLKTRRYLASFQRATNLGLN